MTITAGTKLGRYEVRAKIGEGGMGVVYRARDEKLNRDIAIKVLPAAFSDDVERLHRFEQEAQAAGALNHPNILSVYDVATHDGAPYVVSELLEGESLRDRLLSAPLAQRKAIDYAIQVARGLAAAHEKGIVHRDVKPDNLFITKDDRVKILDFGLQSWSSHSPETRRKPMYRRARSTPIPAPCWEPLVTCLRNRYEAARPIPARTFSRSVRCSTRWSRAYGLSAATRRWKRSMRS